MNDELNPVQILIDNHLIYRVGNEYKVGIHGDSDVTEIVSELRRAHDLTVHDLDEIDNKPWRVFRQLAKLRPEYADTYKRYEEFYSHGGGQEVMKLIEKFEEENK